MKNGISTNEQLGRESSFRKKALTMLVAGFSFAGGASFVPSVSASNDDRTLTNYERQNQGQRLAPWERAENNAARESVTGAAIESSNLPVDAEALQESYDRIRQNSGWVAIEDQVDDQTDRIGELEDLLDQMEVASSWQEQPPVVGAWESGTSGASAMWEPPIDRQLTDFTQTRTVVTTLSRPVTVYEVRASTGERREIDSYIETKTVKENQSREIDVTVQPWANSGGPFDCASWSPAPETVSSGVSYTQTGSGCKQNQSRQISYAVGGSGALVGAPWTQHQTLLNHPATRVAIGIKQDCSYDVPQTPQIVSTRRLNIVNPASTDMPPQRKLFVVEDRRALKSKIYGDPLKVRAIGYYVGNTTGAGNPGRMPSNYSWAMKEGASDLIWRMPDDVLGPLDHAHKTQYGAPTKASPFVALDGYNYWAGKVMKTLRTPNVDGSVYSGYVTYRLHEICRTKR